MATTTAVDPKTFIRTYFEAISGKDKPRELVEKYVTDEHLKEHIAMFERAFPRYELILEDMIAEGDKVVVRLLLRGTHQGELFGVPPTGKQVEAAGIVIYRLEGDKIAEFWTQADVMGLMQQLTGK
jgi:predicted ester cyclase